MAHPVMGAQRGSPQGVATLERGSHRKLQNVKAHLGKGSAKTVADIGVAD